MGVVALAAIVAASAPACSDDPAPAEEEQAADGHDHGHDLGETIDNFPLVLGKRGDEASATRTV